MMIDLQNAGPDVCGEAAALYHHRCDDYGLRIAEIVDGSQRSSRARRFKLGATSAMPLTPRCSWPWSSDAAARGCWRPFGSRLHSYAPESDPNLSNRQKRNASAKKLNARLSPASIAACRECTREAASPAIPAIPDRIALSCTSC